MEYRIQFSCWAGSGSFGDHPWVFFEPDGSEILSGSPEGTQSSIETVGFVVIIHFLSIDVGQKASGTWVIHITEAGSTAKYKSISLVELAE